MGDITISKNEAELFIRLLEASAFNLLKHGPESAAQEAVDAVPDRYDALNDKADEIRRRIGKKPRWVPIEDRPERHESIVDLLEQDEFWVDGSGNRLTLEEMGWSHRRNLMRWLRRKAEAIAFAEHARGYSFISCLGGEMAIDTATRIVDATFESRLEDPLWITKTPLYRRLDELTPTHDPREAMF